MPRAYQPPTRRSAGYYEGTLGRTSLGEERTRVSAEVPMALYQGDNQPECLPLLPCADTASSTPHQKEKLSYGVKSRISRVLSKSRRSSKIYSEAGPDVDPAFSKSGGQESKFVASSNCFALVDSEENVRAPTPPPLHLPESISQDLNIPLAILWLSSAV